MVNNILETFDLTKVYELKGGNIKIFALDNANISVKEGEIFGLLGPNGAGKTTMIQILTTLKQPTSGYAIIDGYDIVQKPKFAKSKIALMLGSKMLYHRITAYDNLKFFCKIYKVPNYKEKIQSMIKELELTRWLNQYVENFSSGMMMKLALCKTLLLDRDILFLDEPTLGLDVNSVSFIVNKLKNVKKTIFLTSHDMNVIEKLCNRIAFINKGKIVKIGTKRDLKRITQEGIKVDVDIKQKKSQLKSELYQQNCISNINETENGFVISLTKRENYKDLLSVLYKYDILKIQEQELKLEDLFLNLNQ